MCLYPPSLLSMFTYVFTVDLVIAISRKNIFLLLSNWVLFPFSIFIFFLISITKYKPFKEHSCQVCFQKIQQFQRSINHIPIGFNVEPAVEVIFNFWSIQKHELCKQSANDYLGTFENQSFLVSEKKIFVTFLTWLNVKLCPAEVAILDFWSTQKHLIL